MHRLGEASVATGADVGIKEVKFDSARSKTIILHRLGEGVCRYGSRRRQEGCEVGITPVTTIINAVGFKGGPQGPLASGAASAASQPPAGSCTERAAHHNVKRREMYGIHTAHYGSLMPLWIHNALWIHNNGILDP